MPPAPALPPVEAVPAAADEQVVEVLAEAFGDYPMLRYLIGVEGDAFTGRLRTLLTFFVAARRARAEPLLGVRADDGWAAVALATLPDAVAPPGALDAARERTWRLLGAAARVRYEDLGRRWQRLAVAEPHLHLNLVGVRTAHRGRGLGVALVQSIVDRSLAHPTSCGVALTTETEANVGFYRSLGFEVRGEVEAAPGLRSWVMFCPTGGDR
jgi:ribosomal protein S18 acetylase RimI-like enzyme